ncbi:MAG: type I methionyl aminopeptidase [Bacteroidota bacterium]
MAEGAIIYKNDDEIEMIRQSALLVGKTLAEVGKHIAPGVSTGKLDKIAEEFIRDHNAIPAFKDYKASFEDSAFPFSLCVSVNEEVVHGFAPDDKFLQEGDIVSVDCGVLLNGFYGDSAYTFPVGEISAKKRRLLEVTKECLYKGIEKAVAGHRLGEVSNAIQRHAEMYGYSVVRELVGHGIGRNLHEPPEVPNYGRRRSGVKLKPGLVIAIEPMINMGKRSVKVAEDNWTVYAEDRQPSAHFEHCIAVRNGKPEILSTFDFIEN